MIVVSSEESCNLEKSLAKIGVNDIGMIIKLMCLTAAGRIQMTDGFDDDNRYYSTILSGCGSLSTATMNLLYDPSTCNKLQHLGRIVQVLTKTNRDSASSVMEMCTRVMPRDMIKELSQKT